MTTELIVVAVVLLVLAAVTALRPVKYVGEDTVVEAVHEALQFAKERDSQVFICIDQRGLNVTILPEEKGNADTSEQ